MWRPPVPPGGAVAEVRPPATMAQGLGPEWALGPGTEMTVVFFCLYMMPVSVGGVCPVMSPGAGAAALAEVRPSAAAQAQGFGPELALGPGPELAVPAACHPGAKAWPSSGRAGGGRRMLAPSLRSSAFNWAYSSVVSDGPGSAGS